MPDSNELAQEPANPIEEAAFFYKPTAVKGWLSEGSIHLDDAVVEHAIQPPDKIQLPALRENALVLAVNQSEYQFTRFAGQQFEGACQKNAMFLLPEGVPSEFAWTGEDEAIVFGISSASLRRTAEQADVNPDKVELKPVAIAYDKQITRYAHCLLHEIRTGGLGSKLYSESILTCLNIHLLRYYCAFKGKVKSDTGGLAPYKLKEILAYIKTNLADGDLSLGAMADLAQLSSYYFSRQFKQSTGYAPHKYVMQQRIEKAKRLLKQRQLPLMQVAFECGFSNQSHFGKVFKQATGTTPRRYREGL